MTDTTTDAPVSTETVAELSAYRAVLDTSF